MADRRTEDTGTVRTGSTNQAASADQDKLSGRERVAAAMARTSSSRKTGTGDPSETSGTSSTPPASSQPTSAKTQKRVRKAHLRLTHVDPWSVMKTSFLFSIAIGIVWVVAVAVVWAVLGAAGIWESIDSTVADVVGQTGNEFRIEDYLGMSRVMGFTMIVAVVDVVLVTVIGTLGAFLYNLAAALLGGIEVVLAEDDR